MPRAAAPRRAAALARRADDDPGGVGEPRHDVGGEARVLPVPRVAHGAVGRPRVDRVHRRHRHRRGARPQRPAPEPLLGHRRRPRDHGQRGRRGRRRPGARRAQGPAPARADVPRRHRQGPHRRRRGDQGRARRRAPVRRVARAGARAARRPRPTASTSTYSHQSVVRRQETFGYTHEELKLLVAPMARTGAEAHRLDGHRHADRGAVRSVAHAVRLLLAAVRAGHQPAARRHPRGAGHVAVVRRIGPEGNLLDAVSPSRAARSSCRIPIIDNDELAKLIHINDDGEYPEFARARDLGPLPRRRRRRRAARGAGPGARTRRRPRSPRASASSCCPTATPTPSGRRSRRCCSSRRCTTTSSARRPARMVGLVVEAGDAREVHHMALLLGYGAGAVNPYLAFESIEDLIADGLLRPGRDRPEAGDQELHQGRAARACSR